MNPYAPDFRISRNHPNGDPGMRTLTNSPVLPSISGNAFMRNPYPTNYGSRNSAPTVSTASMSVAPSQIKISDQKTSLFRMEYEWRLEGLTDLFRRCREYVEKIDAVSPRDAPLYNRAIELETEFDKHLSDQQNKKDPLPFIGTRFTTSIDHEISDLTWHFAFFPFNRTKWAAIAPESNRHAALFGHVRCPEITGNDKTSQNWRVKLVAKLVNGDGSAVMRREGQVETCSPHRPFGFEALLLQEEMFRSIVIPSKEDQMRIILTIEVMHRVAPIEFFDHVDRGVRQPPPDTILISADGSQYEIHSWLALEACPAFDSIFRSSRSLGFQAGRKALKVLDMKASVLHALVRFVYESEISPHKGFAEELLAIGKKTGSNELFQCAESVLMDRLRPANLEEFSKLAEEQGCERLKAQISAMRSASEDGPDFVPLSLPVPVVSVEVLSITKQ